MCMRLELAIQALVGHHVAAASSLQERKARDNNLYLLLPVTDLRSQSTCRGPARSRR
jgi:hypothetical protein